MTAPTDACGTTSDALARLVGEARAAFDASHDEAALENAKARFLGRAGALTEALKSLGKLPAPDRPAAGARINDAKAAVEDALARRREALADEKLARSLAAEADDVSLPGRGAGVGGLHPITRVWSGWRRCSARSASRWPTARRSRTTSTTSPDQNG